MLFVIRQLEQYLAPSRGESLGGRWDLLEVRRLLYFGHDMFDYSTVCISVLIALISFPWLGAVAGAIGGAAIAVGGEDKDLYILVQMIRY